MAFLNDNPRRYEEEWMSLLNNYVPLSPSSSNWIAGAAGGLDTSPTLPITKLDPTSGDDFKELLKPIERVHPWYSFQPEVPGAPPPPTQIFSSALEYQHIFNCCISKVFQGFYAENPTDLPPQLFDRYCDMARGKLEPPQIATSSAFPLNEYVVILRPYITRLS
ncbi:hypothetical protein FS749_000895 [Ceratobasidium sp. UAMH 11750]|nr:hypothetical protein FS749_000895 [Ceratobasidium sp. UAMH 11750]